MIWSPDHLSKRQDCRHIFERFLLQKIYTLTWKQSPPGNSAGDLFGMLKTWPFWRLLVISNWGIKLGHIESPGWLKQTCRLLVSFLAYERQKLRPGFFLATWKASDLFTVMIETLKHSLEFCPEKYENDLIMCSTEMPCGKGWEKDEHLNCDVFAGWDTFSPWNYRFGPGRSVSFRECSLCDPTRENIFRALWVRYLLYSFVTDRLETSNWTLEKGSPGCLGYINRGWNQVPLFTGL